MRVHYFVFSIVLALFISAPFIVLFLSDSEVTIKRPYHEEYRECLSKLSDAQEKNECRCECGSDTLFYGWLGLAFLVVGVLFFVVSHKKIEEKENQLKEKDKRLQKLLKEKETTKNDKDNQSKNEM